MAFADADVVRESRRVLLSPKGSMSSFFSPITKRLGDAAVAVGVSWFGRDREWNLVQDAYWWAIDAMPLAGTDRICGLIAVKSVRMVRRT